MADTYTTNLNLTKPEPGAAEDTWGISLNDDLDTLDAIFSSSGTQINLNPNQVNFADGKKAIFGTDSDLSIFHNGVASVIQDNGTGNLFIQGSSAVNITNVGSSETYAAFNENGAVALYYDNSSKLVTTSSGVNVNGTVTADNAIFGTTSDSQTIVYITSSTTGESELRMGDTDTDAGSISYTNSNDTLTFRAAAANRMSLNSSGLDVTGTTTTDTLDVDDVKILSAQSSTVTDDVAALIYRTSGHASYANGDLIIQARSNASRDIYFLTGSTTPVNRMQINGNGDISFYDDTGTTQGLFWDASAESLGIGTTSVIAKLHVESANNYNGTNFESNPHLAIDNGTPTNHTAVLMFESSGTDASNKRSGITGGNYYSNKHGLGFFGDLASKDRSATPDMFVNSSGNVGIGTSSPSSKLDVITSSQGDTGFKVGHGSAYNLTVGTSTSHTKYNLADGDYHHKFNTRTSAGASLERFKIEGGADTANVIFSNSNVGIGTSSPSGKLTVSNAGESKIDIEDTGGQKHRFFVRNSDKMFGIYDVDNTSTWFRYAGDATASNRKVALLENGGNVGVGTSLPQDKLSIEGGNVSINNGSAFQVGGSVSGNTVIGKLKSESGVLTLKADSTRDVQFGSETNGTAMFIEGSNGRIGIGTTAPAGFLEINGGTGVATTGGTLIVRQDGDASTDGIALTSSNSISHRIWKDVNGKLNIGPSTLPSALVQDLSGNVGIGTSSPSFPLHVATDGNTIAKYETSLTSDLAIQLTNSQGSMFFGLGGGEEFAVATDGDLNGSNNLFVIQQGGNVGIGTTTPNYLLDIEGSSSLLRVTSTSGDSNIALRVTDTTSSNIINFGDSGSSTAGRILYRHTGDSMAFNVAGSEALRIINGGNIGIGTDSPSEKLEISDTQPTLRITDTAAGSLDTAIGSLEFYSEDTSGNYPAVGAAIKAITESSFGSGHGLALFTNADATSPSERVRISQDGNVGIGTSSPTSILEVRGDGGNNKQLRLSTGATTYWDLGRSSANGNFEITEDSGDTYFAIDKTSGNVGIGTTSPNTILEIASGNSGGDAALDSPTFRINNTTESADWDVGDVVGTIEYYTSDVSGNAPYVASFIKSVNETGNGTLPSGALTFGTATYNASGGAVERLRIDSSGNVGIGTTSPSRIFTVENNSGIFRINTSTSTYPRIEIGSASGTTAAVINRTTSTQDIKFGETSDTGNYIFRGGNVGIGTDSPSVEVDIQNTNSPQIRVTDTGGTVTTKLMSDTTTGYVGTHTNHPFSFLVNNLQKARIDSSGNLLVGTTNASGSTAPDNSSDTNNAGLRLSGSLGFIGIGSNSQPTTYLNRIGSDGDIAIFRKDGTTVGSISTSSGTTSYNTTSDARLKDVTGEARGLEVITKLNPVAYNWKADGKADEGLIAQEVKEIVPNAVSGSEDEHYQMDYSKLVTPLVKAIQEQQEQIESLKSEIAKLKGE